MAKKKLIFLVTALVVMLSTIFLTPDIEGLTHEGKAALGIGLFAVIVWISQALDDAQSGFCIVGFLVLFRATSVSQALSGYASTGVWIVILGMIMAAYMGASGLSKRVALFMVSKSGHSPKNLYWVVAFITLIMTFFIPSLGAKTLLIVPIIAQMGAAFGSEKGKSNLIKGLLFTLSITGTMFCVGIFTSHAANPITANLLENATHTAITWGEWFVIGMPPAFLCGILSVVIIIKIFPPEVSDIASGHHVIKTELEKLGAITLKEKFCLVVFLLTLLLWATDKIHHINATIVALLAVIAFIAPGPQQIMGWKEVEKKIPWNIFVVYGAGLSMGSVLAKTGAAAWIAQVFFSPLSGFDIKLQLVIFIWIMLILQILFTGAGPKTTALTPVIIAYAMALTLFPSNTGMDITPFVLIIGMNMLHQYALPVNNLPSIIVMATEEITPAELIKIGLIMSAYAGIFMSIMVYTYWTWIGLF